MIPINSKKVDESRDKILVLISDTGPSQLMMKILESMVDANLEPHVIIYDSNQTKIFEDIVALGIMCERIVLSENSNSATLIWKTIRLIRVNNYPIVYASGQYATLFGIASAFLTRVPKRVFTRHHSDSNFYRYKSSISLTRGFLFDVLYNWLATEIVAVSDVVKKQLVDHEFVKSNKVVVINNSVSDGFLDIHRKYQKGDTLKIGVISRLTGLKGIKFISEAFSGYYKINTNCDLTIIGEESDSAQEVRRNLSHLPSAAYKLIPKISDTKAFYSEIDLFIHVPIRETAEAFGLVYLESLFSGVHCIFTKSGIISADEELPEFCIIVDYEDSNAILREIALFANQGNITKKLPRSIIERYSPERMKESYKAIWMN
jgi:glycosyltransferase involved in cell wall biosynthesis